MAKEFATVIGWDEIDGEATPATQEVEGEPTQGFELTRGDDAALVAEIRAVNGDEPEDDGDGEKKWGWRLIGVAHLPKTTIIEWRSDRGHHAVTMICWNKAG